MLFCLLLAGVVALEMRHPDSLVLVVETGGGAQGGPDSVADGQAEDGTYRPPGESVFQVIEERPLFSPDRLPREDAPVAVPEGPPPPSGLDGLMLTGIIHAGDAWVAIVEPTGPPRPGSEALSLQVGETLRGWTVEEILEDRMVLAHSDRRFEMVLTEDPTRRRQRPRQPPTPAGGVRTPGFVAPQPQQPAPQSQTNR
ncbi:MAG: hypothetical protein JSU82_04830 [Rhodospirillales bacterium]|nr:MAG: hypothetical protein JSU82_04830 [Rhodospirillales bacterium]